MTNVLGFFLPLNWGRTLKGMKKAFTSFTKLQLALYQCPRVKLHAFTRVHQVSPAFLSVKLVKLGESSKFHTGVL